MTAPVRSGGTGDAPVHDVNFSVPPQHDVFRLEVAVDDAPAVAVFDGVADFEKAFQTHLERAFVTAAVRLLFGNFVPAAVQILFQRDAVDELHGQMQTVLRIGIEAEQRNDGRVVQLGIEFRLGNELLNALRAFQVFLFQRFDDDLPAEHPVMGQKDFAEPAFGDHLQNFVPLAGVFQ